MSWFNTLFTRHQIYADFSEEIQQHLAQKVEALMASGMSRRDAEFAAKREFGNLTRIEQSGREAWIWPTTERILSDLVFGVRRLIRQPGFTLTVVVTLALSIGVNTAIFSLVNALLIKTLPYPHPERLGMIFIRYNGPNLVARDDYTNLDGQMWEQLRDNVPALDSALSAGLNSGVNLRAGTQSGSHAQYVHGDRVSARYFDVLGLKPALGRSFSLDEDRPGGPHAAILSYVLWRNTFNSNPHILGTQIQLKGESYTVVGVLPEGATTPTNADVYTTLQASQQGEGGGTNFSDIVRLRDGATWQEADAQINRAFAVRSARFYRKFPGGSIFYYNVPLQKAQNHQLQPQALALMASAGLILLIACANLAGLTLVHVLRRQSEIATRLALGATSWQIQRQFWIENLLLALIGGLFGLGTGFLALRGLLHLLPEHFLPVASVSLDGRVLAFTLGVSLLTGILFGLFPAIGASRPDLNSTLKESSNRAGTGFRQSKARSLLVISEVSLALVLLIGAALLIRTFLALRNVNPGFNPHNILTMDMSLTGDRFQKTAGVAQLAHDGRERLNAIPGVEASASTCCLPLEGGFGLPFIVVGRPLDKSGQTGGAGWMNASPGYFDVFKIPILRGRDIKDSDSTGAPGVVLINESMKKKFWPKEDPVGQQIIIGKGVGPQFEEPARQIIGVVGDIRDGGLNRDPRPLMIIPQAQVPDGMTALNASIGPVVWLVRTHTDPHQFMTSVPEQLRQASGGFPVARVRSMEEVVVHSTARQDFNMLLLTIFGASALILAAIGIYGLMAYTVQQRTQEMGIRMALGADRSRIRNLVVWQGMQLALIGALIGVGAAFALTRLIASFLFGVKPYDPIVFVTVPVILSAVALFAVWLPATRASKLDPMESLRVE